MEYLIEFVLELIFESGIEASKSERVPKFIRYVLIFFITLFFLGVIGLILFTGILMFKVNVIAGLFFIFIGLLMLIMCVIKFRKNYLNKRKEKQQSVLK